MHFDALGDKHEGWRLVVVAEPPRAPDAAIFHPAITWQSTDAAGTLRWRILIAGFVPEGRWPSCRPSSAPRACEPQHEVLGASAPTTRLPRHIVRLRAANSFPSVVAAHQAMVAPAVVTDVLATAFGEPPTMTLVAVTMSTTAAEVSVAAATTPTMAASVAATVSPAPAPAPAAAAPTAASTTTTAKTTATKSATAKAGAASSTAPAASATTPTSTASPAPMSSRMSGRGSCYRHCAHRANSHQRINSAYRHGCRATYPGAATCVLSQHFRLLDYALSIRSRGQRSKCNVPRQKAPIDQDQAPALKVTFKTTLRLGASFRRIAPLRWISAELGFATGVNSSTPLRIGDRLVQRWHNADRHLHRRNIVSCWGSPGATTV
jgi:hypothetical protein